MRNPPYIIVQMNQYAVTDGLNECTNLISGGAEDCVILLAYCKGAKTGLMCHVDRSTHLQNLFEKIQAKVPQVSYYLLVSEVFSNPGHVNNGNYVDINALIPAGSTVRKIASRNLDFNVRTGRFWTREMAGETARRVSVGITVEMPAIGNRNTFPTDCGMGGKKVSRSARGFSESPF